MTDSHRYTLLICSLPHHEPLFRARRAPLSRLRLRQRQSLLDPEDRACLRRVADLLEWARQAMDRPDAEFVAYARAVLPQFHNHFARDLVTWRLEVRTVIAALRRRQRGQDTAPAADDWGVGRWLGWIRRHWTEPQFGLERVYPWLADARALLESGDALGLERLLLGVTWRHLDRIAFGHEFDFEAVLVYSLRWDLVSRWTGYREQDAGDRFDELFQAGQRGVDLDRMLTELAAERPL